jgi:protein AFG1
MLKCGRWNKLQSFQYSTKLKDTFNLLVASGDRRDDPSQRKTVSILEKLHEEIIKYDQDFKKSTRNLKQKPNEIPLFSKAFDLFLKKRPSEQDSLSSDGIQPKGIYLHGNVGTGKTMTMDLFYHTLPITSKRRVHFHDFMLDIHKRVHQSRQEKNTAMIIPTIARNLIEKHYVICFDEFQVTDIADAMILRSLLTEMLKNGAIFIITSNRHPTELYKNGIQRSSFLPCIDTIMKSCLIHELNSGIDYRKQSKYILNSLLSLYL